MAGKRIVIPNYMPALDIDGSPVAGAKLYFYENGTTTLATVYTSAALSVAHANPVVADAAGVFPSIFADDAEEFSVAITDANGKPISGLRNYDNIAPSVAVLDGVSLNVSAAIESILSEETLDAFTDAQRFLPSGTGAAEVSLRSKLREIPVQPNLGEFGAFTNATVTTATLLKAFTAAMADGRPVELSGSYTINGPITPIAGVDGAELHIRVKGDVTITVDSGASAFNRVFFAESTTVTSHSVTGGGTLTIDCNDLAAAGLWLRHDAAEMGGSITLDAPVKVLNVKGDATTDTVAGIMAIGRFERIVMRSPHVEEVTRLKAAGECSGITCSGFEGDVEIYSPVVRKIRIGAGTGDADGIKCFGYNPGTTNNKRRGRARIYDPVFEDCQGRSFKNQCGDAILYRPLVVRDAAVLVGIASTVDIDFQYGNGIALDGRVEYRKDGATSPLGASHSIVAFQQVLDDATMYGAARNFTVMSDVMIGRFALQITGTTALASVTEVDGLTLIPTNGLSGTMLEDGVLQFDGSHVATKAAETGFVVRNVRGPLTCPALAYNNYSTGDLSTKLSVEVDHCSTTLAIAGQGTRAVADINNTDITTFKSLMIGDNPGFRNYYPGLEICLKKMRAGCKLIVPLDSATFVDTDLSTAVTVPWGVSGTLYLECMSVSNYGTGANDTVIRAYLNNATVSPSAWFTQYGGVEWGPLN